MKTEQIYAFLCMLNCLQYITHFQFQITQYIFQFQISLQERCLDPVRGCGSKITKVDASNKLKQEGINQAKQGSNINIKNRREGLTDNYNKPGR